MTGVEGTGRPGWPARGVERVLGPAGPVADELADRGWDVVLLPPAETDGALWDGFADALDLPGWFGRNLDALDEVLRARVRPTALVLAGWSTYARARPERWRSLLHLLSGWASESDPGRPAPGRAAPGRLVLLTD